MKDIMKISVCVIIYEIFAILLMLFVKNIIVLDKNLFLLINRISNLYLDSFFICITFFGSSIFWIFMIFLTWFKHDSKASAYLIYVFILDTISLFALKWLFLRPRPFEAFESLKFKDPEIDMGPSFPSGHSQRAFSGAIVLGKMYKKFRIIFMILAFLATFSRIYNGMHYPLDTLVGAINGIIIGSLSTTLPIKKFQNKLDKYRKLIFKN